MITPEELFEVIMFEEGQDLVGLDLFYKVLKLSKEKISKIFNKAVEEYGRRIPFSEEIECNSNPIILPANTISAQAIRYGIMPEAPRFIFPTFGLETFELHKKFYNGNKIEIHLKKWPPISGLRVKISRGYTLSKREKITEEFNNVDGWDFEETIKATPRKGTLSIVKNNLVSKEVARKMTSDECGSPRELIILDGDLGKGVMDLETRKIELDLVDKTEGNILVDYYPQYECCVELDNSFYVFNKMFASRILRAIAVLKENATQQGISNVDLTTDDLIARANTLQKEVAKELADTKDYGGLAPI